VEHVVAGIAARSEERELIKASIRMAGRSQRLATGIAVVPVPEETVESSRQQRVESFRIGGGLPAISFL